MTTDKPTCGTCRYWSRGLPFGPARGSDREYGVCYGIRRGREHEMSGHITVPYPGDGPDAFTVASDHSSLVTAPEFGCTLWEPTNGQ